MRGFIYLGIFACSFLGLHRIAPTSGECIHNGRAYLAHTVWQPGPCSVCTCEDPIIFCENIRCTNPQCDFKKGEYLQISADGCCPECMTNRSSCIYQQQTIPHNTEWNPELCVRCRCEDGDVDCGRPPCPETRCRPGEISQHRPGSCCPQCIPAGRPCTFEGIQYPDSANWEPLRCTQCVCTDGQYSCYPVRCPPLVCSENEVLGTPEGTCCPVCQGTNSTCREGVREYKTGDQWSRDPCTLCVCIGGTIVCTQKECVDGAICQRGEEKITRPGECCPDCVPMSGTCKSVDPPRYSGDLWNSSRCEYCMCDRGQVTCHTASCENTVCFKEEVLMRHPDNCCPQCVIPPTCEQSGQVRKDGSRWMEDECTLCYCDGGTVRCYSEHCPACPSGQRRSPAPGECCSPCEPVHCSPQCQSCEVGAPDNCTACTNTQLYVQDGRCLHTCRMGFYPSPRGLCLPCHASCYTCVGGTQYHCDMCQPGLMWKDGECVTQCGLGYYLQNGRCLECAPSCKSCSGPGADQCLSCANPAQVVSLGKCVDDCSENSFVRSGKCVACHPTCKSCLPDGSGCAICWPGALLQLGQCVTGCSPGFYDNKLGSCSVCHASCETCEGPTNKNCSSCYPGNELKKKGKCRSVCDDGKYMDVEGLCRNCAPGCQECHAGYIGDGTWCTACVERDHVPERSGCIEQCKVGQYQEHKTCKDCSEECLSCTSPSTCTRCSKDTLLYLGHCVRHCGQRQFEDGATLTCKDCSSNCLSCYGVEECSVCDSTTFLQAGKCVAKCRQGFVANPKTRLCQRNTGPPVFKVLNHVEVPDGELGPILLSMFYISDPDTSPESLTITVVTTPLNGDLIKVIKGQDVKVKAGDNVTVSDMLLGKLWFKHKAGKSERGKCVLQVTDSQLTSAVGELYVQAVMPSAISIATRSLLLATQGEVTVISTDVLNISAKAADENVKLTILQGPKQGVIVNKWTSEAVRVFSLAQLRSGVIGYKHKGQPGSDIVMVQASDGFHVFNLLLHIQILEKASASPVLMRNNVGHVSLGSMLKLSPDLLQAKCVDGSQTEEVVYTLNPSLNNPQEGEMIMVVPIPPSGITHGWDDLGDGNMAARLTRFLQRDIDEGRIFYKNKGTAALTDFVRFEIADTGSSRTVLTDQTFKITVREKKNPGPITHPTLVDGATLKIRVLEGQLAAITPGSLHFVDDVTEPSGVKFTLTHPLGPRDGSLEHVERPSKNLKTFTQEDVNNNRIIYRPPFAELGFKQRDVFFYFTVEDEEVGVPIQEHKFVITLLPVNNQPPRLLSPTPVLRVSQGGSVPIGQSVLTIVDDDTPLHELTVTLTRGPHSGLFEKATLQRQKETINQGGTFPYPDLASHMFQYSHDGSSLLFDTMQFSISDGNQSTPMSVDVKVIRVDKTGPQLVPSATCRLVVKEGTTQLITRDVLAFTDQEDSDISLKIALTMETTHGKLLLSNQQVIVMGTFTQADINSGKLSYLADSEVGINFVSEVMTFNVSDLSGNILPSQTLYVLIEPVNNVPPKAQIVGDLKVSEGMDKVISSDLVLIDDLDTPLSDLTVTIVTQPEFGAIRNREPESTTGLVTSFAAEDLRNGYIFYTQSDHAEKEPVSDGVVFYVDDGANRSPPYRLNISIEGVNDEPPVVVLEQLFVQEGQSVTLTNTSIFITDLDTGPGNISLVLGTPPEHGVLKRKVSKAMQVDAAELLKKNASFVYKDILEELLIYVHDGSEVSIDSFSLVVSDGNHTMRGRVPVILGLVSDETPRVTVNRGLRVYPGSITPISNKELSSSDLDTDADHLTFTLTSDPKVGSLYLTSAGQPRPVSMLGPVSSFKQLDIDQGYLEYRHNRGESTGSVMFKFTISDPERNEARGQEFYITVLEDRSPPRLLQGKELVCREGGEAVITPEQLSYTDEDSQASRLQYVVTATPLLGHLENKKQPGVLITEFSQADITNGIVKYVHTSTSEEYADRFTYSVTDGSNHVTGTFHVTLTPVDDSIPMVTVGVLRVQQGVRKLISEFDLRAVDLDTKEDSLTFTITLPPRHGTIELLSHSSWNTTSVFSMTQIYENQVSYLPKPGEATSDVFMFSVTDGTNNRFTLVGPSGVGQVTVPLTEPQTINIEIMPMDLGSPIIVANQGLQFLEVQGSGTGNIITSHELRSIDDDTLPDKLKYVVRTKPAYGRLEMTSNAGVEIGTFTQENLDNSLIRYVLTKPGLSFEDNFVFDLYDGKPNRVPGNVFHITWSSIEFEQVLMNITETSGLIQVPVIRKGYLKQYSMVTCATVSGTATSSEQGSRPGQQDFVQHMGQVQFDEWQDKRLCTIIINDDSIFEGRETFYVELVQPTFTLLGPVMKTSITIEDMEDEPVLQFQKSEYHVQEGDSYLSANIIRTGDISSTVSTICYTSSLTARGSPLDRLDSGSDYISRGNANSNRVIFPSGVTMATCDVKLIDDSVNEGLEQFDLQLTLPSYGARLGPLSHATIIIEGPNDESSIHFSAPSYLFSEDAGTIEVEILRSGADIMHSSTVWCATRLANPPSASAGQDYVPSASQITFGPGQTSQKCELTLLDDSDHARLEGDETFIVFLSSAMSSNLIQPYTAIVHIDDSLLDVPTMSFISTTLVVDESAGLLEVPIMRTGDSNLESSAICYTSMGSAELESDYIERRMVEASRIVFHAGEKMKNCTVKLVNDDMYEANETLHVKLVQALGADTYEARIGDVNDTLVTITNQDDVPRVQFERSAYSIPEPNSKDQISTLTLKIMRSGDVTLATSVKCSTRDGSATSRADFIPKSQVLVFPEGVRTMNFSVDILYNSDIEWHETFSLVLSAGQPTGAMLGTVSIATITILDNDVSGSMVLPAPPVVVSLLHYDDVTNGMKVDATPGYPVICVTPCDPHYPSYSATKRLCSEANINQTAMYYRWEVSVPDMLSSRPPFMELSYNTIFTSVNHITLDSIYFRPSFRVRCVAQPLNEKGNPGIPLKSNPVTIGRDNAICQAPAFSGLPFSYQAQSFHAKLFYVGTEDPTHPNTIHVSVQIPHQDGMLPLLSTFPITNLKYLLSEPVYRQQHLCSNLITPNERSSLLQMGFLNNKTLASYNISSVNDFPYQFDANLRQNSSLMLYKYLDLKKCMWNFEAWFAMTDLVDLCGGRAVSDFQVRGGGKTYLTVRVPLYVSYLYAVAPIGWGSLEHMTELEFSFYYDTVLWRSGLETQGDIGGRLQVMRVLIQDDGRLVVDFKTQAKFRGLYVLSHPTLPEYKSRFISKETDAMFDIDLVWGQNTFDGPQQLWRATSHYSFKDYTGEYVVELIPCTAQPHQGYTILSPPTCTAHKPQRFDVPIAFQQSNRPVPLEYTLNTHFQLTNNEQTFLRNPFTSLVEKDMREELVAFSQGDRIYGRVMWSPEQDLKSAYTLSLEKVFICTGSDGHVPTYDPTGSVYNNGPQYGCIQPSPKLKYRFHVLDRGAPHMTAREFEGVKFDAQFVSENQRFTRLMSINGLDGFVLNVGPLYKVTSGFQWYIQVIYSIGPADSLFRRKRYTVLSLDREKRAENMNMKYDWFENNSSKNGTNIQILHLNNTQVKEIIAKNDKSNLLVVVVPIIVAVILIVTVVIIVVCMKRRRRRRRKQPSSTSMRNNLELANQNSVIYKGKINKPVTVRCSSSHELKQSVVYKADHGKMSVRIKDTNIQKAKNITKGNGTEV